MKRTQASKPTKQIDRQDFIEYLETQSDLSFELRVLLMLRGAGLQCVHGGLYEDPLTKKMREFDIRAVASRGRFRIALAIECKNLTTSNPLLVSCVPRHESEAYHDVATIRAPTFGDQYKKAWPVDTHRIRDRTRYPHLEAVGKRLVQLRRDERDRLIASDAEAFEKWTQALASATDLIAMTLGEPVLQQGPEHLVFAAVIPIVVVPNGTLWTVHYDFQGARRSEPEPTEASTFYVGKEHWGDGAVPLFSTSHIEITTQRGLNELAFGELGSEEAMQQFFPHLKSVTKET